MICWAFMKTALHTALFLLAAAVRPLQAAPPSPESVLGFRLGEDRVLADWTQLVGYYKALDAASDRVRVEEVGRTTEDRPFLVVTITSEANQRRLEEIRRTNLRLADPRGLTDPEAARLLEQGRTIVALNHGIHSDEVAASQTAAETAYWLASSDSAEVAEILDQTVVVMLPSHNPDGTQRITEWYRKTLGTPYEGADMPFLYQKYTGHDNNRDWYMFTQRETRLTVAHLYDKWHPQIVHDLHQMGARTARIFLPPYVDPWEPNVDPALRAAVNALGSHVAAQLTAEGKTGAVIHALYDAWSPARAYPHTHGGVRILSEVAEARMATPRETKFEELASGIGYDPKIASWNFPAPWPGGTWRLRDIMDYQRSATRALLLHAARHRAYWLRNFLDVGRRATARTRPFAFVIPAEQKDPLATAKLLEVLHIGGLELERAAQTFTAAGRRFEAGAVVVHLAQPAGAFAKMLLERQHYPDLRQYPGGPPQRPYDVTAHTLPLLLGVEVAQVDEPFEMTSVRLAAPAVSPGRVVGRGSFLALGHKNGEMVALGRLLRGRVPVRWTTTSFRDGPRTFPAGTLLVPAASRRQMEALARELGLVVQSVDRAPASALRLLRPPRVGLYQSWGPSMDEGWTRFVFEQQLGIDYETLHDKEVRAGDLRRRFDVIVLPDETPTEIVAGHLAGTVPDEYTGGLGREGVTALKHFAEAGGTLVTLDSASGLAKDLGLPVTDVLGEKDGEERFYCPGALLEVQVDTTRPLAHGLETESAIWFESSPAFEVSPALSVARSATDSPLLSGWLLGGSRLRGRTALVEAPLGQGRVVLFGFRPQYRAQSWATYLPLANAIYLSAAEGRAASPPTDAKR
jgi:hypothetical protein